MSDLGGQDHGLIKKVMLKFLVKILEAQCNLRKLCCPATALIYFFFIFQRKQAKQLSMKCQDLYTGKKNNKTKLSVAAVTGSLRVNVINEYRDTQERLQSQNTALLSTG